MRPATLLLSFGILGFCASCAEPPPPGVDPAAYARALQVCKEVAWDYGYGRRPFGAIGNPQYFIHDTSWEVVDPCLRAHGFPPPPY